VKEIENGLSPSTYVAMLVAADGEEVRLKESTAGTVVALTASCACQ
jgi:hypothetical protein